MTADEELRLAYLRIEQLERERDEARRELGRLKKRWWRRKKVKPTCDEKPKDGE